MDGLLLEGEPQQVRLRLEALRTRMHTWRTAAVMTCFFTPVGLLFGLAGLLAMANVGSKIAAGQEQQAKERLDLGRKITLLGTGIAILVTLAGLVQFVAFVLDWEDKFEQLQQLEEGRQ
jgi:hypothetical protein